MKEFVTAFDEAAQEAEGTPVEEQYVEFKLDGRTIRAYEPTEGQLAFMLAAMGRGQSDDGRFAAIVNIVLSCLRSSDRDYMEARLLSRDPKERLPLKQVEAIVEHLTEEWFGRPTQPQSDSAPSPQSDGQN